MQRKVFTFKDSLNRGIHLSPSKMYVGILALLICMYTFNKGMYDLPFQTEDSSIFWCNDSIMGSKKQHIQHFNIIKQPGQTVTAGQCYCIINEHVVGKVGIIYSITYQSLNELLFKNTVSRVPATEAAYQSQYQDFNYFETGPRNKTHMIIMVYKTKLMRLIHGLVGTGVTLTIQISTQTNHDSMVRSWADFYL